MSEIVKAAAVLGAAIMIAVWGAVYYSPYQECVRASDVRTPGLSKQQKAQIRMMCQMGWRN